MIGKKIGHHIITELLGEGGMAVVYKAHQPSLNRDVAIKILTGPLARDEEFVTRFRREAVAAGALGHPNILTVHDAGMTEDGLHYIVMEHAQGGTLGDLLRQRPLSVERACEVGAQVADALQAAHEHGIVHRDLKPSNILLTRDDRPLLMDFGVALVGTRTRLTRAGTAVGTPEYMSPEQAQGLAVDARSDVYSLGILMYEMLTGNVPYVGDTPLATLYQHVHQSVPELTDAGRPLPAWLTQVVEQALAKQPEDRYQTAGQMAVTIRGKGAIVSAPVTSVEKSISAAAPEPAKVAPKPRRRGGAFGWTLAIAAAVILVAGGTYWLLFRPSSGETPAAIATQPIAIVQSIDTPDTVDETATLESIELAARTTETTQTQIAQAQTATAIAVTISAADETIPADASVQSTQDAQAQMATIAANVVATAQAKETEDAKAVAQGTQAATETVVALTAEAGSSLAASLTAEAQATQTARVHSTETAEAQPTWTTTPLPPTSTATRRPPTVTATPIPQPPTPTAGTQSQSAVSSFIVGTDCHFIRAEIEGSEFLSEVNVELYDTASSSLDRVVPLRKAPNRPTRWQSAVGILLDLAARGSGRYYVKLTWVDKESRFVNQVPAISPDVPGDGILVIDESGKCHFPE